MSKKKLAILIAASLVTSNLFTQSVFAATTKTTKWDINRDGKVDSLDMRYVKHMSTIKKDNPNYDRWKDHMFKADFNGDKEVTDEDVRLIEEYLNKDHSNENNDKQKTEEKEILIKKEEIKTQSKNNKEDVETKISNKIKKAMLNFEDYVYFDEFDNISGEEIHLIFYNLTKKDPIVRLYNGRTVYTYTQSSKNGYLELKYSFPKEELKRIVKDINDEMDKIISKSINNDMSDYEKVKALNDYLLLNSKYDTRYTLGLHPSASYTPYGVLIDGTGNCDGYAITMKLLLDKVGIESEMIYGLVKNNYANRIIRKDDAHVWNLVKIDDQYYHLDIPFQELLSEDNKDINYSYFLTSDNHMKESRDWFEDKYPKSAETKHK